MARISVYVPDSMKLQMDALGDRNWSEAAQAAFRREISLSIQPGDPDMDQVIERLRASKAVFEESQTIEGRRHGQQWAKLRAKYEQLRAIDNLSLHEHESYAKQFDDALGASNQPQESFWFDPDANRIVLPSDEYVKAYMDGALEVWDQVEDKI